MPYGRNRYIDGALKVNYGTAQLAKSIHFFGPLASLIVLLCAGTAALVFAYRTEAKLQKRITLVVCAAALVLLGLDLRRPIHDSLLRLQPIKSEGDSPLIFERWNSYSRVTVRNYSALPFTWSLSSQYDPKAQITQKYLEIDANASTVLTEFKGNFDGLGHLRAELNDSILIAVQKIFKDFVGGILSLPNVSVVHDEGRSYKGVQLYTDFCLRYGSRSCCISNCERRGGQSSRDDREKYLPALR